MWERKESAKAVDSRCETESEGEYDTADEGPGNG